MERDEELFTEPLYITGYKEGPSKSNHPTFNTSILKGKLGYEHPESEKVPLQQQTHRVHPISKETGWFSEQGMFLAR